MARVIDLSHFNYNEDILVISETCALHRGRIIYKTEFDRLRAREIIGYESVEIQFDFDTFLIMRGNLFIDYNEDDYNQLTVIFNAKRIQYIQKNPEYLKLAMLVSLILQKPIINNRCYFRLDISEDYTKYYNMIVSDYKKVNNLEFDEYKTALHYLDRNYKHYKHKNIIHLKYTNDFNLIGFRPIDSHLVNDVFIDNINANILKTIGELDRFIETVQYWKLQNA